MHRHTFYFDRKQLRFKLPLSFFKTGISKTEFLIRFVLSNVFRELFDLDNTDSLLSVENKAAYNIKRRHFFLK